MYYAKLHLVILKKHKELFIKFTQFIDKDCKIQPNDLGIIKEEINLVEVKQDIEEPPTTEIEPNPPLQNKLQTILEAIIEVKEKIRTILNENVIILDKNPDAKEMGTYEFLISKLQANFNSLEHSGNVTQDNANLQKYINDSLTSIESTKNDIIKQNQEKSLFSSNPTLNKVLQVLKSILDFFKACLQYLTFKTNIQDSTPDKKLEDLNLSKTQELNDKFQAVKESLSILNEHHLTEELDNSNKPSS